MEDSGFDSDAKSQKNTMEENDVKIVNVSSYYLHSHTHTNVVDRKPADSEPYRSETS